MALDRGSRRVPVFAAKGYLGNMGAAAGTTELIASILGLEHGTMPPSLNHEVTDAECPIEVIAGAPRAVTKPYALKVGFTQMGQCGAVLIRKA
jgi:3-oxoacyl-[acyl-carrier-protein] synthase II